MIWSASPRNTSKTNPFKMNEKNGIRGNKMKNFFAVILIFSLLSQLPNGKVIGAARPSSSEPHKHGGSAMYLFSKDCVSI